MRPIVATALFSLTALAGTALAAPHAPGCNHAANVNHAPGVEYAHACWPGADGTLTGTLIEIQHDDEQMAELRQLLDLDFTANSRGDVSGPKYIDIVFVGDGYTASEQALFQSDVNAIEASLFQFEPFITYKSFFRVHRVEVISNDSGVDNDPTDGISRDTALDMGFFCGGTERALCVNVSKALTAARNGVSSDVDQVIAIANTTKYGGVGYPSSNLATSSGRNSSATQIVIHELGHSLGNLADEYTYGGNDTYTGGEHSRANLSIYDQATQVAQQRKWHRWMGPASPGFDGPVATYEGGGYSQFGIFRPTNNSMMRSLGRPFSPINAEALIQEFYSEIRPIESATPVTPDPDADSTLVVVPAQPVGHDLDITWFVNGDEIAGTAGQTSLDLASLNLPADAESEISVTVVDNTPWVRDPAIRDLELTDVRTWTINRCVLLADIDGSGELNFFDVSSFVMAFQIQDPLGDFNSDGIYNFFDFVDFIDAFVNPCGG